GDLEALLDWEQKIWALGIVGEPIARYYRARRLLASPCPPANRESIRQAQAEQSRISALRPTWPETHVLRGIVEQRLGRTEPAAAALEQAIRMGERRIWVFERLIALLDQLHRSADCERYLSLLAAEMPFSQPLTELAGAQEMRLQRPEQAIEIARQGVRRRPADPAARVWLARLLMIYGRKQEAEQAFKEAIAMSPTNIQGWSGLFYYYLRIGE